MLWFLRSSFTGIALCTLLAVSTLAAPPAGAAEEATPMIRLGLVGLDTSHVITYTRIFSDPKNSDYVPGVKVVAGWKGGSPEVEASATRVDGFTKQLAEQYGVEIVPTLAELCKRVDGVLLTSVDSRQHVEQARQIFEAGVPLFIDKPLGASLAEVMEIARMGRQHNVPWFGGSSLRWSKPLREALGRVGDVKGCNAWAPGKLEPHHPDLFWYGVHGVEALYTAMGTGCRQVTRTSTKGDDVVVGLWDDGRIGVFRGPRNSRYSMGVTFFGTKAVETVEGHNYQGMAEQMVKFFRTGQPPVPVEEVLEMYAFMEAADTSKAEGGKTVPLPPHSLE